MDLQKKIHRNFLKREHTEKCSDDGSYVHGYTYKKRKKNKHKKKSCGAEEMHGTDKERNYHLHSSSNESPSSDDITEAFDLMPKTGPLHFKDQNRKKERNTHLKESSPQYHCQPSMSSDLGKLIQKWPSLNESVLDADNAASELESSRIKGNDKLSETKFIPEQTKELHERRGKNRTISPVASSSSKETDVSKEKRKRKRKKSSNCQTIPARCDTVKVSEKVSSKSTTEGSQLCPLRKKKKSSKNTLDSWGRKSNLLSDIESILLGCKVNFLGLDNSCVKRKLESDNGCKSSVNREIEGDLSSKEISSELSFRLHITSSESECSESIQKDHNEEDGIQNLPEETTAEGVHQKAHKKKSLRDANKNSHSPGKETMHLGNKQSFLTIRKKRSQKPKSKSHSCENTGQISVSLNTTEASEDENESERRFTENAEKSSQYRIKGGFHYCTQCDIKFDSIRALMSHDCPTHRSIAPRPSGKERTLACSLCGRLFVYNYHLNLHYNTIHRGKKNYKCAICDKLFSVKQTLIVHWRVHNKEKPYECEICDYKCITSSNLNRHYRVKHGMVQSHECRVCSYKFFSEGDLNLHLQERHKTSSMQVLQSLV